MALTPFTRKRKRIVTGILTLLLIFSIGSSTAVAQQLSGNPEAAPAMSNASEPALKQRKAPVDQGVAALVELLKKKNMITDEEAAAFRESSAAGSSDQAMAALLELLQKKNVISNDEAAVLAAQAAARRTSEQRVTIAPESGEKEQIDDLKYKVSQVKRQIAEMVGASPDWTKRVRFGGDIRMRYEHDRYDKNNALFAQPANPTQLMNTQVNQDTFKYRVRVGVAVDVSDQVETVVRVSTGNTTNPVSTNTVLGDYMNKDNVVFDLAYLKWQPSESITLTGGRMPNPWFSSDLVWDRDLNFEGLALNLKHPITESLTSYLTLGAFPLQKYDFTKRGKFLLAGQAGLESNNPSGLSYKLGAAYYHFSNITGERNDPLHPGATDWTAPLYQQKGNTLFNISADPLSIKTVYASEFKELNFTGNLDIGFWHPFHIVLLGDYVKNLGFKTSDVAKRTGISNPKKEPVGYQMGLSVGYPTVQDVGQWKSYLYYKRLEADAVVDAFTDSDFHLGGTNTRGWILGGDLSLKKNTWISLRWMTANEISGPPLAIDVLQLDFNARF